jgi:hypothetical protein
MLCSVMFAGGYMAESPQSAHGSSMVKNIPDRLGASQSRHATARRDINHVVSNEIGR